jgi:fructose-1,6-bisphosphatase/inositol monophosphatase family enzyme/ADP-ribosylglycohydrolase
MSIDLRHVLTAAIEAARAAGELLRAEFHREGGIRGSGGHAPVDEEMERLLRTRLLEALPRAGFVGEETGSWTPKATSPAATWYVDPNDGTSPFIDGWRGSAVSIGLVQDGVPVLGVVHAPVAPDDGGDLIAWAEGCVLTRNGIEVTRAALPDALGSGLVVFVSQSADRHPVANAECVTPARYRALPSIAYRLALTAVGEGDAATSLNGPTHWDVCGGHALLRAVGGELVGASGEPVRYPGPVGDVFGGAPGVARALRTRPWKAVMHGGSGRAPFIPASRISDAGTLRRAQGALLGLFTGDALGVQVEFQRASAIADAYPGGVREMQDDAPLNPFGTIAGQVTDDGELALALTRRLIADSRFDARAVRAGYLDWHRSGPFDCGITIGSALAGTLVPGSQSNGSLMRVTPLALAGWRLAPSALAEMARADAGLTHLDPVPADANAAFSIALAHLVRTGESGEAACDAALAWARAVEAAPAVIDDLERASEGWTEPFTRNAGWVRIAFRNAFHHLLRTASFEEALVRTIGQGGDTDTNAAIVGALVGARDGRDAIPLRWRRAVLSARPQHGRTARPQSWWAVEALALAEGLLGAFGRPARDG